MWIDKLSAGVLRVFTPLGPRYIQLSFKQRMQLLWIFRHFEVLPLQVLGRRQRALVESLCAQQHFIAVPPRGAMEDFPLVGTIERRPPVEMETVPAKRPATSARHGEAPVVGGLRQRS